MKKIRLILAGLFMMMASVAFAQNINVTGTVTDASTGETIIGAAVVLNGDNTVYAYTDAFGEFTLQVPADGVLRVEFTGYKTVEIPVNGKTVLDIQLDVAAEMLEDVVVVGYGTAKKISSVVGSASTVKNSVTMNRPSANVGDALQGQVSGLQIYSSTGEPSASVSMRLRGVNTINADSSPLFVLDGTPVSAAVFSALNSNDIENIVVMKDASSTAIYGSRAANGVIYITTKKGKSKDRAEVRLTGQYGFSTMVNHNMDLMNTQQWFDFQKLVDPNYKLTPDQQLALDLGIDTEWIDYYFKETAPVWSADLSVSGASEKSDYYISLGAFSQEGTAPGSDMSRVSLRTNVNTKATKWLQMGANLGLSYQTAHSGFLTTASTTQNNPINSSNWNLPYWTPYEIVTNPETGESYVDYNSIPNFNEQYQFWDTFFLVSMQPNNTNYIRLNGSTYIQINPIKGLTFKAQQGLDSYDYRYTYKQIPTSAEDGPFQSASAGESFSRYYQFTFTNTAEYNFDIHKNNFSILLGQESLFDRAEGFGISVSGLTDWRNNLINQAPQENVGSPSYSLAESAFNSYFARLSYNYGEKYFLDASWRMDGSSLFGKDNQYANFYSVGAMWDIKRESFLQRESWIQDLRFKVSYGTTGNSGIGNYLAFGLVSPYSTTYDGNMAWGIASSSNPDLTWETIETLNVALTARLWNFFNFSAEFYNKVTHGLLMSIPYSYTTGFGAGVGNAGDMLNRGIDIDLGFDIVQTRDLYFGVTANFSYNYNEILELFNGRDEYTQGNSTISMQVGYPYGELYAARHAGVDPRDGMMMYYDLDGNKTKQYSDDYKVMTGKQAFAPFAGGIQLSFQYKSLYIGADFSWVAGKYMFNNDRYFLANPNDAVAGYNGLAELLDMWVTPGQITDVPSINSPYNMIMHDGFIENASFLRLKNLQVSYSLPQKWMDRTGFIRGFKIYAVARNLFTITEYSGYDPEVDSPVSMGVYPNSRQFTVGAEFTF